MFINHGIKLELNKARQEKLDYTMTVFSFLRILIGITLI